MSVKPRSFVNMGESSLLDIGERNLARAADSKAPDSPAFRHRDRQRNGVTEGRKRRAGHLRAVASPVSHATSVGS
jgi:hypothetical protein